MCGCSCQQTMLLYYQYCFYLILYIHELYLWVLQVRLNWRFSLQRIIQTSHQLCALFLECSIQIVSLLIMFNTYSILFLIFLLYILHFGFIKKDRIFLRIGLEENSSRPLCGNIIVRAPLVLSLLFCVCYRYIQLGYLGLCSPIPVAISSADVLSFWIYLCFSFL